MYSIIFEHNGEPLHEYPGKLIVEYKSVFLVAWTLQHSDFIKEFTVMDLYGDKMDAKKNFGYGTMDKWK